MASAKLHRSTNIKNMNTPATHIETLIGPDRVMDVREISCSIKHGLILRNCFELAVGDHFILMNGHDPAHLREEISKSWPGAFAWEYIKRCEDEVRVKITKLVAVMENLKPSPNHD